MKKTLFASILIASSLNAAQKTGITLKLLKEAEAKARAYEACMAECIGKGLRERGMPPNINQVPTYMRDTWIRSKTGAEHECLHGSWWRRMGLLGLGGECGKILRKNNGW